MKLILFFYLFREKINWFLFFLFNEIQIYDLLATISMKSMIKLLFNPIPTGGGECPCPPPPFRTRLKRFWYDSTALFTRIPFKPEFDQKCGRYYRFSESRSAYFSDFLHCFLLTKNAQVTFAEKPQMKINSLRK